MAHFDVNASVPGGGVNIAASDATFTSGTVNLSGSNMVTVRSGAQGAFVDFNSAVRQVTLSGNTSGALAAVSSGTMTLAGGNNITLSQAGNAVTISGGAGGAETQTAISGIVGSNATYTSGTVTFTGVGGGITVSSNTGQRIDLSVAAPVASSDTGKLIPLGNTTGTTNSISLSGPAALAGGNNITLSMHSDSSTRVTISAASQSAAPVGSLAATGNTTGTMATIPLNASVGLEGGNNVTLSQSSGASSTRLVISVPNTSSYTDTGSLVPGGNTTGTTASLPFAGQIQFSGGNNITISQSSGTNSTRIGISGPNTSAQQTGISSISVSNTDYTSGRVVFTGSNMITVKSSGAGQTAIIDATQTEWKQHVWANQPDNALVGLSSIEQISKTPFYFPVTIDGSMTLNSVGVRLAAVSSVASSVIQSFSVHMGIYTLVNSTSAALAGSASNSFNLSSTNSASYLTGRNFVLTSPGTVAGMSNLTPGNYIFGLMFSGAASQSHAFSVVGASANATSVAPSGAVHPGNNSFSTATSQGLQGFLGQGSTTVAALPANVSVGDLRNQGTATVPMLPYVYIRS